MGGENHSIEYWKIINDKASQMKKWIKENQIDGKVDANDIEQLIDHTFALESSEIS